MNALFTIVILIFIGIGLSCQTNAPNQLTTKEFEKESEAWRS